MQLAELQQQQQPQVQCLDTIAGDELQQRLQETKDEFMAAQQQWQQQLSEQQQLVQQLQAELQDAGTCSEGLAEQKQQLAQQLQQLEQQHDSTQQELQAAQVAQQQQLQEAAQAAEAARHELQKVLCEFSQQQNAWTAERQQLQKQLDQQQQQLQSAAAKASSRDPELQQLLEQLQATLAAAEAEKETAFDRLGKFALVLQLCSVIQRAWHDFVDSNGHHRAAAADFVDGYLEIIAAAVGAIALMNYLARLCRWAPVPAACCSTCVSQCALAGPAACVWLHLLCRLLLRTGH
jgi:DNA repair exonuclease SbcCD ATPase subunit